MDKTRITSALQEAAKVTRASQEGENTAGRVGGVMEETLHCIEDAADAITNIENGTTPVPGTGVQSVVVTQDLNQGTPIAKISVNGNTPTQIYAPTTSGPGSKTTVTVTDRVTTGDKIATINVDSSSYDIYNGGGGGSDVVVSRTQGATNGTEIADIQVDGVSNKIYSPTVQATQGYTGQSGERVEVGTISIGGTPTTFYAPSAGESSLAGAQQTYFTNVVAGTDVSLNPPTKNNYNENNNTFGGTYTWTTVNQNPPEDYDTWMLVVWFKTGVLRQANIVEQSISVVKIFDSTAQGSNGEDSNEIEWIYTRSDHALEGSELQSITSYLATTCKGSTIAQDGKTFIDEDAIPTDYTYGGTNVFTWYDHPKGIEESLPYEYASYRVSTIDSETKKRKWGTTGFSQPIIWAKWGEKGLDGDGVEYIFAVADSIVSGQNPSLWDPTSQTAGKNSKKFQDKEYLGPVGSIWVDDPVDLSNYAGGTQEWVSKRKYNGETELWEAFSAPALWAYKAEDGLVEGYIVDLDNENMPVGTDDAGNVYGYSNVCTVQAFHNNTRMTCVATKAEVTASSNYFFYEIGTITRSDDAQVDTTYFTAEKASSTSAIINVSMGTEQHPITNFDQVVASIPVTVWLPGDTDANPISYSKVISVYGIATGEAGQTIDLYVGASSIQTDYYCQNVYPETLEVGVRIGKGNSSDLYLSGTGSSSAESQPGNFTFKYQYYWTDQNNQSGSSSELPTAPRTSTNGPITLDGVAAVKRKYLVVRMYMNGKLIDAETIHYLKEGAPGIGYSAINYNINVLSNNIIVDPTTNKAEGSISFNITRTEAGVTKVLTNWTDGKNYWLSSESDVETQPSSSDEAKDIRPASYNGMYNPSIYVNGSVRNISLSGKTTFNITVDETLNAANPFTQVLLYSSTSMPLTSVVVPFIFKGDKGDSTTQSINGIVTRFRGWSVLNTDNDPEGKNTPIGIGAVAGASGIIYKDIIVYNNEYFYIAPSYTGPLDPQTIKNKGVPKDSQGNVNSIYQYIPMVGDAAFQTLLARVAYIENLTAKEVIIVKDNKPVAGMTSGDSYTTLPDDVILGTGSDAVRIWSGFNAASGNLHDSPFYVTEGGKMKANNADISGKITATDGTIGGFTISDRNLVSNTTINDSAVSITPSSIKIKSASNSNYYTELTSTGNVSIYRGQTAADNSLIVNGGNSRIYLYGTGNINSRQQFIVGGEEDTKIRGIARFNCYTQFNGPVQFNKGTHIPLIKVEGNDNAFGASSYVSYGLTDSDGNSLIPEGATVQIAFCTSGSRLYAPTNGILYHARTFDTNISGSYYFSIGLRSVLLTYAGTLTFGGTPHSNAWIARFHDY